MVELTFLEVHLHDSPVTANAPFSGSEGPEEADEDGDDSEDSAGGFPIKLLLALVAVAVAIVAAKKLLSGEEVELEAEIEAE